MKLKFERKVRKLIADELKKISNFGGVGLDLMGYSINSLLILCVYLVDSLSNHLSFAPVYSRRRKGIE